MNLTPVTIDRTLHEIAGRVIMSSVLCNHEGKRTLIWATHRSPDIAGSPDRWIVQKCNLDEQTGKWLPGSLEAMKNPALQRIGQTKGEFFDTAYFFTERQARIEVAQILERELIVSTRPPENTAFGRRFFPSSSP